MRRALLVALLLSSSTSARGAETDNFYAWRHPPRESGAALESRIQADLERGLFDVNAWPGMEDASCREVADAALGRFFTTGLWFFVGPTTSWGFDYVPNSNREYLEELAPVSVYRFAERPLPGNLVPLDPTTRLFGVHVGVDKVGHFLTNGGRYYDVYLAARERGAGEEQALGEAIELGIAQEEGILGLVVSSIFSYADLEANFQGLELYRWLCEGDEPALQQGDDRRWRLVQDLDLARYVNPCWDESWFNNAYGGVTADGAVEGIALQCPLLDEPYVEELRRSYEERGCDSYSYRYLMTLLEAGELPDPRPFDVEAVCSAHGS